LKFEYLKADWVKFFEAAKAKVTEKEIADEFAKRKEGFRMSMEDELARPLPSIDTPEAETDDTSETAKPADDTKNEPGETKAEEKKEAGKPADKPADKQPEEKPAAKDGEKATEKQPEAPGEKKLEPPRNNGGAEGAADEPATSGANDKPAAAANEKKESPAGAAGAKTAGDLGQPALKSGPAPPEPDEPPPVRAPEPPLHDDEILHRFRDELITSIATESAQKAIDKALDEAKGKMDVFYELDWTRWRDEHAKASPTEGPKFDLARFAKADLGLTFHRTTPLSAFEARREPELGKSLVVGRTTGERGEDFVQFAFTKRTFYQPARSKREDDLHKHQYVFWRIDESAERVPSFTEIRDEVLRVWKISNKSGKNARDLARVRADDIARNVRGLNQTLKERYLGESTTKVIETDAFSWRTRGRTPLGADFGFPRLSDIEGVEEPGDEFMRSLFQLKDREIGVATNAPGTVVYVAQVFDEPGSDPESLRRLFTSTPYSFVNRQLVELLRLPEDYAQEGPAIISYIERPEYFRRLFDQLEKLYDVEWVEKEPDAEAEQT
jgi:hypothetical protein